ncbi:MAG: PLP-dependent aminotransferase family protein [Pedobacter sp.]|nr:MAG: PLP-dependent aminotransferase family protein [Pedobacter sp.]
MDSPVQIPFKSFIQLKPEENTALYLQIVFQFIKAIQMGFLPEGTKLPGTRTLCQLLSVNRNTLIKAFQDLESQGFIEISPNIGTFILTDQKQKSEKTLSKMDNKLGFTFKQSLILEDPSEKNNLAIQFNDGDSDLRLVQTDILARLYVSKLKRKKNADTLGQMQLQSRIDFKLHFSNFLNVTRGLRITSTNILISSSHELSLYLVTKALISTGDKVVVASPNYYRANMTLLDCGAQLLTIPVDEEGLSTTHLRQICEKHNIRALYITSNFHYPSTTLLSAKRRMEVLEMASLYDFVILEDDYDFDFHYDNNSILPLAAMDVHAKVIYVGSFARFMPSGFGYGFVSAPSAFIRELEKHQGILEPAIDVAKEQVLTSWIQDGEVHRLIKKNKKLYRDRRDYFVSFLDEKLKGKIKYTVPARGLAIWVEWLDQFSLVKFKEQCASHGLFLPKTILYQNKKQRATRLGFGHLTKEEMTVAIDKLRRALEETA